MMEMVECPKCEALTVKANFCRGCGASVKEAEVVEVPSSVRELIGSGFVPGPRSRWENKLWAAKE